jgi:hypothetical protein
MYSGRGRHVGEPTKLTGKNAAGVSPGFGLHAAE